MPVQNKVLFNIAQNKTDQEKAQARSNIGVLHNVTFISNTGSPTPTLAQVQAMLDAGDYVILMYNDGVNPVIPMTVLQDVRTAPDFVSFVCVSDSSAITVKLTDSGFGTPTTKLLDAGKLEVISVSNGTVSMAGLHVYIGTMIGLGKIPLVKYEESVTPSQFGYYFMMYRDQLATNFVRVTENAVKVLSVSSSDQITISSYPFSDFDMENLAPQWTASTYKGDELVTDSGHLYRSTQNSTPADPPATSLNVWTRVNVASLLGRVRDATEEAVVDPNNPTKWEVPNNALCVIETSAASPVAIEIDIKLYDKEVANAVVNLKSAEGGTVTVKVNRYILSAPNVAPTVTTCFYSKAAGNVIPANKDVQITCVGNRWTWGEYVNPNP